VFARLANGNAQTVRRVEGQKTLLARTQHSIFYNHLHDEMVVMNPWAGAVLTFRGDANGEVAPIRIIQGPKTGLALSDVMSGDPVNNEYYVPAGQDSREIYVFDRLAEGDVAPKRTLNIGGGGTGGNPSIDYEHNVILLAEDDLGIQVFNRTDSGDMKPLRVITGGPRSGNDPPAGAVWIPGTRNFLASTRPYGIKTAGDRPGAPSNYQTVEDAATYVGVWTIDDSGDVAPRFTIAHNVLKEFRNFAVNGKNREIMISDKSNNSIFTFSFPEAWETFAPVTAPPGPAAGTSARLPDLEDLRLSFVRPDSLLRR
jgi:hypothetical protein